MSSSTNRSKKLVVEASSALHPGATLHRRSCLRLKRVFRANVPRNDSGPDELMKFRANVLLTNRHIDTNKPNASLKENVIHSMYAKFIKFKFTKINSNEPV